MDTPVKPALLAEDLDLPFEGDTVERLVLDIADLVDWTAHSAPRITQVRQALRDPRFAALGFVALTAATVALLLARRKRWGCALRWSSPFRLTTGNGQRYRIRFGQPKALASSFEVQRRLEYDLGHFILLFLEHFVTLGRLFPRHPSAVTAQPLAP
jgi:hypothetical protein